MAKDNSLDGLEWLREILSELSPEQTEQFIKQLELLGQNDLVTKNARLRFETGKLTIDRYGDVIHRQHGLLKKQGIE